MPGHTATTLPVNGVSLAQSKVIVPTLISHTKHMNGRDDLCGPPLVADNHGFAGCPPRSAVASGEPRVPPESRSCLRESRGMALGHRDAAAARAPPVQGPLSNGRIVCEMLDS